MKKLVPLALILTVLVSAVLIISRSINGHQPVPSSTSSPAVPDTGPAVSPTTTTKKVSPISSLTARETDAVAAAVLANASLSAAQLLPAGQLRSVLQQKVIPANRRATEKVYLSSGQILAKLWGYQSVSEARVRAGYYVATQKFKIVHVGTDRASIELYNFTHFRTTLDWDRNQEHWDASVTVVDLRRQGGKWLFADAHDPPIADRPVAETHLSFEETKTRLQPYLRGFSDYANMG